MLGLSLGGSLAMAGVLFVVFGVANPPPGDPVATADFQPGQTFTAEWIADGYPKRAWLDFDCYGCAFPFRGSARIASGGIETAVANIEVWSEDGYAVSSYEGGGEDAMHGKLLFDVPALPAGVPARITGVLSVASPRLVWSSDPSATTAPPPRFTLLRFWVAR